MILFKNLYKKTESILKPQDKNENEVSLGPYQRYVADIFTYAPEYFQSLQANSQVDELNWGFGRAPIVPTALSDFANVNPFLPSWNPNVFHEYLPSFYESNPYTQLNVLKGSFPDHVREILVVKTVGSISQEKKQKINNNKEENSLPSETPKIISMMSTTPVTFSDSMSTTPGLASAPAKKVDSENENDVDYDEDKNSHSSKVDNMFRSLNKSKSKPKPKKSRTSRKKNTFLTASCGDDGDIVVWDGKNGEIVHKLEGHRLRVTCLSTVASSKKGNPYLLSGSADRTIRMWDLRTGKCAKILEEHTEPVKFLEVFGEQNNRFCSAGNESNMCVWNSQGVLEGVITRHEEGRILSAIISLPNNRLVTASDDVALCVYSTVTFLFEKTLKFHEKPINHLKSLNDQMFVSASIDGLIVIWSSEDLKPMQIVSPLPEVKARFESLLYYSQFSNPKSPTHSDESGAMSITLNNSPTINNNNNITHRRTPSMDKVLPSEKTDSKLLLTINGLHNDKRESFPDMISQTPKNYNPKVRVNRNVLYPFASAPSDSPSLSPDPSAFLQTENGNNNNNNNTNNPSSGSGNNFNQSANPETKKAIINFQKMVLISQRYLAVAYEKDFCVFDLKTGKVLLRKRNCHKAEIAQIITQHFGNIIVTASNHGEIKFWYTFQRLNEDYPDIRRQEIEKYRIASILSGKPVPVDDPQLNEYNPDDDEEIVPFLIGRHNFHSGAILKLQSLSEFSFVSCGVDKQNLLWKDAHIELKNAANSSRAFLNFSNLQNYS